MMQSSSEKAEYRSLGGLFSDLSSQVRTLIRKEIELAFLETRQNVAGMAKDILLIGIGGVILIAGLLVWLAMVVIVLNHWMPLWVAALVVAAVTIGIGAIVFLIGKNRLQQKDIRPSQTIISLKENKAWIQNRI